MVAPQNSIRGALEEGPKAITEMIENLAGLDTFDKIFNLVSTRLLHGPTYSIEEDVYKRQLPILHKWELAGSDDVILVHHYFFGEWRAIDPRLLKTDVPSHDLSEFQTYSTAEEALKSMGYFL